MSNRAFSIHYNRRHVESIKKLCTFVLSKGGAFEFCVAKEEIVVKVNVQELSSIAVYTVYMIKPRMKQERRRARCTLHCEIEFLQAVVHLQDLQQFFGFILS